ncbi:MAG: helix-turn-helix domain-containing protein [Clostridia bacterium]|nr:helix-turn-helix domain-containing protein [Clostridia bacterium]
MMYEFGERIYNLRKKSGLSQEEFADKLGVSRQAVSKWETGQSVPDSEKAAAMAKFFGVSLDWLINGEEPFAPVQPQAVAPVETQSAVTAQETAPVKKMAGWVKAIIIAGVITLAAIGVCALSAFIFMLAVTGAQDFSDTATFYMLLIVVPGWVVLFLVVFIISIIVIRKKRKK